MNLPESGASTAVGAESGAKWITETADAGTDAVCRGTLLTRTFSMSIALSGVHARPLAVGRQFTT